MGESLMNWWNCSWSDKGVFIYLLCIFAVLLLQWQDVRFEVDRKIQSPCAS